ncbi:MAG: acylphosphatase [Phycisphaerales bacterium]|jgi:acylphosphatase|nr:acylphosphatase [Phycisphaerales bacterium]
MSDVHRAIIFRGQVQGVGFRWTTARVAAGFAVRGWVRNEPDGSVRCEVAGSADEVEAFLAEVSDTLAGHITACDDAVDLEGALPGQGFDIRR